LDAISDIYIINIRYATGLFDPVYQFETFL